MTKFFGQDKNVTFFELPVETPLVDQSIVRVQKEEDSKWIESSMAPAEVKAAIEATRVGPISVRELAPIGAESLLKAQIKEGATPEEIADAAAKASEYERLLGQVEAISALDYANIEDPAVSAILFKSEHRRQAVTNELMNLLEAYTPETTMGSVAEFIDSLGYSSWTGILNIPTGITGGGSRHEQLAKEWQRAFTNLDEEEFQKFVQERLSPIRNPGFLMAQEPSYRVIEELEAIEAAGASLWGTEMGVIDAAVSVLDLWAIGDAAVTASKVGRSIVGRLSRRAGTRIATDAALGTDLVVSGGRALARTEAALTGEVRGAPTRIGRRAFTVADDVEDAVILDDIVPSIYRSRVRPAGPSVNTGIVASRIRANSVIARFYDRAINRSFGVSDLPARAKAWANTQGQIIADASSTRLINFDIRESVEYGHEVRQAVLQFGKQGTGVAYDTFDDALKASNNIPNSKVIDLRTSRVATADTGSNQFAVEAVIGVSPRDVAKGIQLDDIAARTWMGKLFGRAHMGADDTLSSIADQGVAGFKGFEQDLKREITNIRKLAGKDLETVDTIMRTLRDLPAPATGGSKSWHTSAQFSDTFRSLTGELPSRKTLQAYESLVELSDFSWWISASDRLVSLYNQSASVVKVMSEDIIGFLNKDVTKSSLKKKGITVVWDVQSQRGIPLSTIADDSRIMVLDRSVKVDRRRYQYAVNFSGKTRVPTLVDAFPYNPGGPRTNRQIKRFVGDNSGEGWATLIGTRTPKESAQAVAEFNRVAEALAKVTTEEKGLTGLSRFWKNDLTRLVRENNNWHKGLTTIDEWVDFAKSRGVSITGKVVDRGRGEKLVKAGIFSGDDYIVNLNLDQYVSYRRHDLALREFGGDIASNIDPVAAITHQFTHAASRGAMMRYRIEHPTAWVKEVMKRAKDDKGIVGDASLHAPLTDEGKVRTWKIIGDTEAHKKLRQEQSVINRRLNAYDGSEASNPLNPVYTSVDKSLSWVGDVYWDLGPGKTKFGSVVGDGIAELFKGTTYLTFGFFTKMADASQFIMQSTHAGAIASISPKNGFKATFIASAIRQMARGEGGEILKAIEPGLKKLAGVDDAAWEAFKKHMFYSGRGYMRGALSEDPTAATLAVSKWDQTKNILSTPFYAGENYSQTVSRTTAFFDVLDSGRYVLDSDEFWNAVVKLDRTYSFGLNKAQASIAQTDRIARVGTQWSSYQLGALETVFSPHTPLTRLQRGRLAMYVTLLWGVAGTGVYEMFPSLEKKVEDTPVVGGVLSHGLDALFEATLGIRPGERIAIKPLTLIERAASLYNGTFWENAPAGVIAVGAAKDFASTMWYLVHGNEAMATMGVERLARTWKVVDNSVMAYNMLMEDVRTNRTGTTTLEADFSASETFFQAVGFTPAQALDLSRRKSVYFDIKRRKAKALDGINDTMKFALKAFDEGNHDVVLDQMRFIGDQLQAWGFSPTMRLEILNEAFRRAGDDNTTRMFFTLYQEELLNTGRMNY
jgi:hypothetical protein